MHAGSPLGRPGSRRLRVLDRPVRRYKPRVDPVANRGQRRLDLFQPGGVVDIEQPVDRVAVPAEPPGKLGPGSSTTWISGVGDGLTGSLGSEFSGA